MKKNLIKGLAAAILLIVCGICFSCGEQQKISMEEAAEAGRKEASEGSSKEEPEGKAEEAAKEAAAEKAEVVSRETAAEEPEEIQVYVCGAVVSPGVYALPAGSRLYQAIERAGGMTEEAAAEYLNLAEAAADGLKIQVPTREEIKQGWQPEKADNEKTAQAGGSGPSETAKGAEASEASGLVNINTADTAALMTLPGIGNAKAESILAYRTEHGGFKSKEDIMNITGIKQAVYEKIKDLICVE